MQLDFRGIREPARCPMPVTSLCRPLQCHCGSVPSHTPAGTPSGHWDISLCVAAAGELRARPCGRAVSLFYVSRSPGCAQAGGRRAGCLLSKTGRSFPCGSVCLTSVQANSVSRSQPPLLTGKGVHGSAGSKAKAWEQALPMGGRDSANARGAASSHASCGEGLALTAETCLFVNTRYDIYKRP